MNLKTITVEEQIEYLKQFHPKMKVVKKDRDFDGVTIEATEYGIGEVSVIVNRGGELCLFNSYLHSKGDETEEMLVI